MQDLHRFAWILIAKSKFVEKFSNDQETFFFFLAWNSIGIEAAAAAVAPPPTPTTTTNQNTVQVIEDER